jgi:hypothetical protein
VFAHLYVSAYIHLLALFNGRDKKQRCHKNNEHNYIQNMVSNTISTKKGLGFLGKIGELRAEERSVQDERRITYEKK